MSQYTDYGSISSRFPYEGPGEYLSEAQRYVRRMWANALRSGKYKQGSNSLQTPHGEFCCLGVLCDLLDHNGWTTRPASVVDYPHFQHGEHEIVPASMTLPEIPVHRGSRHYPDAEIARAAGISELQMNYLAQKNDLDGLSFSQIADLVEQGIPVEPPVRVKPVTPLPDYAEPF